jgi:flagellar motor switch protein FliM
MTDVLAQSEIDALLAAVDTGEVEEIRETIQIFSRRPMRDLEKLEVRPYDFKRPERVGKDQMRALQTLHEAFARNFGAQLSGFLRTIVEVKVASCEQMTYGEFISGLPNPTAFNLLYASPLDGAMCLEISPLIIYPIIDRLLGGSNQELFIPQRPMTAIEERLVQRILSRAITALDESWASIKALQFRLGESESNPQLVQIVPPNEVVVVVGFELKTTNRAGTMNLCIPYNVIEPLMGELSKQSWFNIGGASQSKQFAKRIGGQLSHATLELTGVLAETTITLRDLMNLSPGDLIVTEKPAKLPAVLAVEKQPKFFVNIGQFKGDRAIKVVKSVTPDDRI